MPILSQSDEILKAIKFNNVVIIVSETGSGKTTQVPQLVLESSPSARVVVTQPRRVAAISTATRVSKEQRCALGGRVGYTVRFDDCSSQSRTRIRYVTDGVLLRESLTDGGLHSYSHVIVDEVHERSINTDVVMGVVKRTLLASDSSKQAPLKVVIMSATTDAVKLERFFLCDSNIRLKTVVVPGRCFPVSTMYVATPVQDFVDGAVTAVLQIHIDYAMDGDILVFMPGQDEIHSAISLLSERVRRYLPSLLQKSIIAQPLYASLAPHEQIRAITPLPAEKQQKVRKVIFSTNVAETSITIESVRYVVDAGMAKVRRLHTSRGSHTDILRLEPISMAQADQRKGRAGRTGPGYVFRLYTEDQYKKMEEFPTPEILRVDCTGNILQIMAYDEAARGSGVRTFPFVDAPPRKLFIHALETLISLGAINDKMRLTDTGRVMASIPTSPMLARSILEATRVGCSDEMICLASILSVDGGVFVSPTSQRDTARLAHRCFHSSSGDHITFVNVYKSFTEVEGGAQRTEFCQDHFLNYRTLASAEAIFQQLKHLVQGHDVASWKYSHPLPPDIELDDAAPDDLLQRCIIAGFFRNAARKRDEDRKYVLLGNRRENVLNFSESGIDIHPSSVLFTGSAKRTPGLIIFHEFMFTSKPYLRTVTAIERDKLEQHSGQFYQPAMA